MQTLVAQSARYREVNIIKGEAKVNVTALVGGVVIYQDIFSNFLSGYVVITDAADLHRALTLNGSELIQFVFWDNARSETHTKTFQLYACGPKLIGGGQSKETYVLEFVSIAQIINSTNKTYLTGNVSSLSFLEGLWERYFKKAYNNGKIDVSTIPNQRDMPIFIPGWSPFQTMNYILARTIKDDTDSTFLLYELFYGIGFDELQDDQSTRPNVYNFVATSIKQLMSKPSVRSYEYVLQNFADSAIKHYNSIIHYQQMDTYNLMSDISNGVFAGKLIWHDAMTKRFEIQKYSYSDEWHKLFPQTNMVPSVRNDYIGSDYTRYVESHVKVIPDIYSFKQKKDEFTANGKNGKVDMQEQLFYSSFDGTFRTLPIAKGVMQRSTQLDYISTCPKVKMSVYGDIQLSVGNMIDVTVRRTGNHPTEHKDELKSGPHLITAIAHEFTQTEYYCKIEASKLYQGIVRMDTIPNVDPNRDIA